MLEVDFVNLSSEKSKQKSIDWFVIHPAFRKYSVFHQRLQCLSAIWLLWNTLPKEALISMVRFGLLVWIWCIKSKSILNPPDPKEFRNIILWLEDQKIRHYTIEDRAGLRKVASAAEWDPAYDKYKLDLKFPTDLKSKSEELTWLFLYAIKLEYSDNADRYRGITAARKLEEEKRATAAPEIKSTNPFDNLDCKIWYLYWLVSVRVKNLKKITLNSNFNQFIGKFQINQFLN